MALTQHYVDPSINADSGTGTVGDPWGDLEYCLETATPGVTGNQINVKAGTAETLAAQLGTAFAAGTFATSETNPLIIRGYTTAADDGGIGDINGGGSVGVWVDVNQDYVNFVDMHLHNCGAAKVISLDNYCSFINCEIDTTTDVGMDLDTGSVIMGCYFHDCSGNYALGSVGGTTYISNNVIRSDGAGSAAGLFNSNIFRNNIVLINNIGDIGIKMTGESVVVEGNSFYSSVANTAPAIEVLTGKLANLIMNNLIEGFSGVGGIGIDMSAANSNAVVIGGNAFYNCTTGLSAGDFAIYNYGDNETLSASPFTDASTNDFSPVDTGNVKEGALPQDFGNGSHLMANVYKAWKGAVQPAESGASGNEWKVYKGAVQPAAAAAAFAGTTAGDGGHIWPPRSNDPRWAQLITDSGISATGNFIDDVHTALEAMASTTGQMDDLWAKVLAANSVTDTSEPFTY